MAKKVHGKSADLQPLVQRLYDAFSWTVPRCGVCNERFAPLSLRYGTEPDYNRGVDTGRYRCRTCAPDARPHLRLTEHNQAEIADAMNEAQLWVAE